MQMSALLSRPVNIQYVQAVSRFIHFDATAVLAPLDIRHRADDQSLEPIFPTTTLGGNILDTIQQGKKWMASNRRLRQ